MNDEPDPLPDEALPAPPGDGAGLFGDEKRDSPPAAYRVLARTWRPTRLDQLIGQDAMVRILRRAFLLGRVAHGFMLTGVRGTGKTTTARIIARALNCTGPDGTGGQTAEPCGVCPNCTAILADRHPDVLEIDAASHTGVDDVREIIESTRFRPMQGRMKVFIIDEVHMLSRNAFNALLKTLEEPPPQVTFIFATTELRKVPVTVLSRCQRFDLRRVPQTRLASHFAMIAEREGASITADALALIARAADGSVRDGLSLLDQAISLGEGGSVEAAMVADMLGLADRVQLFDLFEAIARGRADLALGITDAAWQRGADLGQMLADLLELIHTISRLKTVPALRDSGELPEAERSRGGALAEGLSVPVLGRLWQMLLKGVGEVEIAPDRRDAAEMVLIRLCHAHDLPTPGDLVKRMTEAPQSAPVASGAGLARALIQPDTQSEPRPASASSAPSLRNWREVVAHVATCREPALHGHLRHSVHLVRFAAPVIEVRPQPQAPRDLTQRLAAILTQASGRRWTIAVSRGAGEPTLAEQSEAVSARNLENAEAHPLVQAILSAFPGARVGRLHDTRLDAYGLLPEGEAFEDEQSEDD